MTKYDMMCGGCGHEWFFELTMKDYGALQADSEEWICPDCKQVNTNKDRVLSNKIGKIVYGTSKGYFNSGG